ncbi:unnamed protein product [Callosobruchus maculatus]|uniref:Uncharacterized protein n=1 Tax=Callosobruchus maculatus TaxID=64391 RepID=A0A653DBL3_CALMS|nr:unnamed protein product [Callosobruchus maculatus]
MDLFQVKIISVQNFLQLYSFEVVNSLNVMFFVAIKRLQWYSHAGKGGPGAVRHAGAGGPGAVRNSEEGVERSRQH